MQAIIMAGGKGSRLRPYTAILPKPLMPIGDISILEVIFRQLKHYQFDKVTLAVGYLAELIKAYCGDGGKWNMKINYSLEEKNLGTIGPLSLIEDLDDNFLVMNGDILTDLDYKELIEFHIKNKSLATIATYNKKVNIDLGVLETDNKDMLSGYIEKPELNYKVSMGIYVMNKRILDFIPKNKHLDIPSLMLKLIEIHNPPKIYRFTGKWLDIGRKEDYEDAINDFEENKSLFLP